MDREAILTLLRNHSPELHKLGIRSLSVFGSVARGEISSDSDVDLLVEFDLPLTFDRYIQAKFYIEDLLGRPVDLVFPDTLKPRVRPNAEREAIRVA
jgi:uncharacterized protein